MATLMKRTFFDSIAVEKACVSASEIPMPEVAAMMVRRRFRVVDDRALPAESADNSCHGNIALRVSQVTV